MIAAAVDPLAAWSAFFTGMLGGLGALTGLLFVAISNNLEEILKVPNIVGRAAQALWTMVLLLIICGIALTPQKPASIGIESAVLTGVLLAIHTPRHVIGLRDDLPERWRWAVSRIVATTPSLILTLIGGALLITGVDGGLFWIAAGILAGVAGVTYSAWVLLVEVLRLAK